MKFCQTHKQFCQTWLRTLTEQQTVKVTLSVWQKFNKGDRNSSVSDRKSPKITGWQNFKELYISVKHRAISNKLSYIVPILLVLNNCMKCNLHRGRSKISPFHIRRSFVASHLTVSKVEVLASPVFTPGVGRQEGRTSAISTC